MGSGNYGLALNCVTPQLTDAYYVLLGLLMGLQYTEGRYATSIGFINYMITW